jgi:hypothetical protein
MLTFINKLKLAYNSSQAPEQLIKRQPDMNIIIFSYTVLILASITVTYLVNTEFKYFTSV